jgi:hypothetical protein
MIISASRRNDLPAFFSEWFFNRIDEGFVYVRNPMNPKMVSDISLKPNIVDCFVFWTKNPRPMLSNLFKLDDLGYNYYYQFTLNPYGENIEMNVPKKNEIIATFRELANRIGPERVIWRYDPILLTNEITVEYHIKYFEYLASKLHSHTKKCVISYIDFYKKCQRNLKSVNPIDFDSEVKLQLAKAFHKIASRYDLIIETCAEDIELNDIGIDHCKCVDDILIESLCADKLKVSKDINQREACGCVTSIDIGTYNTCNHGCLYCYANFNNNIVAENTSKHIPSSPLLFGEINENDKITKRKMSSIVVQEPFPDSIII